VERASDRYFMKPTIVYEGRGTSFQDTLRLSSEESAYYRVKAKGQPPTYTDSAWSQSVMMGPGQQNQPSSPSISSGSSPVIASPALPPLAPPQLTRETEGGLILLKWTTVAGASGYELESATSDDFAYPKVRYQGVNTQTIESFNSVFLPPERLRRRFFRVKALGSPAQSRESGWSNIVEGTAPAAD